MKRILNALLLFWLASMSQLMGQTTYIQSLGPATFLDVNNDTLKNPWAGGLQNPMFSSIKLDGDNMEDLFIFEPGENRVLTFLNKGNAQFQYAPQYEAAFPPMRYWAYLVDYNNDGLKDIFTYNASGIAVFKNITSGGGLKFNKITSNLKFDISNRKSEIYASNIDLPSFTDVDGDGDLDILVIETFQSYINFYKNLSVESGYPRDSLVFCLCNQCWGRLQESLGGNIPTLGFDCGPTACLKKHGAFSLLALDMDGDGDKDLIQGDLTSNNLMLLKNGRSATSKTDSMVSIDSLFAGPGQRATIPSFISSWFLDLDADGKRDLALSPQYGFNSSDRDQIWFFQNAGADNAPDFRLKKKNFLSESMLDAGYRAAPTFADVDGDGLPDMVMATGGDFKTTRHDERLLYYKNVGTSKKAVFKEADSDFLGLAALKLSGLAPCLDDINGDGKADLVIGQYNGELMYYRNTTIGGIPSFALEDAKLSGLDVGQYSTPAIADVDNDGLQDLIVGEAGGNFNYYRNTGSKNAPAYSLVSDSFGRIRTNAFYYEYKFAPDFKTIIDSVRRMETDGYSSPAIADVDHDGKPDMVAGSIYGKLFLYLDIRTGLNGGKTIEQKGVVYDSVTRIYPNKTYGADNMPSFAFLSNDSLPDLIVGNDRGGMFYFKPHDYIKVGIVQPLSPSFMHIYPNPSQGEVFLEGSGQDIQFRVWNLEGKNVLNANLSRLESVYKLDISHLPQGLYLIQGNDGLGRTFSQKVWLQR